MHPAAKARRLKVETLLAVVIVVTARTAEPPHWHLRCPHCGEFALVKTGNLARGPPTCAAPGSAHEDREERRASSRRRLGASFRRETRRRELGARAPQRTRADAETRSGLAPARGRPLPRAPAPWACRENTPIEVEFAMKRALLFGRGHDLSNLTLRNFIDRSAACLDRLRHDGDLGEQRVCVDGHHDGRVDRSGSAARGGSDGEQ
jgi:hypothetical protein